MKKKIIFCLQTMTMGGVEKELIAVLKQIHTQYDITLLVLYLEDTETLKELPSDVKVNVIGIDKGYYCSSTVELVKQRLKKFHYYEAAMIAGKRFLKIGMSHCNTNLANIPPVDEVFDVAICYHIHSPLMIKFVVEKIQAIKKIGWIHNDFLGSGYPIQQLKKYVMPYHEFVAVSKKVENEFRELCPWYCGSISTAYNYMDGAEIIRRAKEPISETFYINQTGVKLLTVGRFTEQKGIDLAIETCAMLKKEKLAFHWFLIGYGELESTYRKLMKQYDVEDCFTILGKKTNPYPYIKNCDIYVQPSRHEAFGLVILEAKILKKAIVCTNFDGADEQIDNGINGIIVPLNDTNALYEATSKLIQSPEAREKLTAELEKWSPEDALINIVSHLQ